MSDRVKILVVIGQLEIGGTERQLLNILPAINTEPLDITVYALRGGGALETSFSAAGVRVISPRHHSRRWLGLVRTAAHLLRVWRAERPSIVHFYLPEAYLLGALVSMVAPPCVRLMSRRSLNDYQSKWPGARRIERFLHRRMDGILANSNAVRAQLLDEGVDPNLCAVIYNGVAEPSADGAVRAAQLRAELDVPGAAIVVVMVANLIPYKGHGDLLDSFASALPNLPGGSVLLFVGRDGGIETDLRRRAERTGIGAAVKFIGSVVDVEPYLGAADMVVHASREEGFSNAILEAMAAGRPVIATRVGGNAEAVVDGVTGVLVPARDSTALAAAITDLASNAAARERMASAARVRARESFSLERCSGAYRRLYLALADGDRRALVSSTETLAK